MIAHNGFSMWRSHERVGWAKSSRPARSSRAQSVGREDLAHPTKTEGGTTNGRRRAGFTLTELMVVILVIGILASSMLFAMYGATTTAKENRTKTQITKLHDLVMARWESYRTRPVRLLMTSPPGTPASPVTPPPIVRKNSTAMAAARLTALRDLMRLEMPDRKSDVLDNPVTFGFLYTDPSANPQQQPAAVTIQRPAVSYQYLKRANAVFAAGRWTAAGWTEQFQDAECLYMIIASIRDINSNGLDFAHEGEIGDLDEDGMPEILDAWERPIAFTRWPAGFVAHPGPDYNYWSADDIPSYSALQSFVVDANDQYVEPQDRDPFDPLRRDNRPGIAMPSAPSGASAKYYFNFKLYPLVYSGGPDEVWDVVRFDFDPSGDPSALIPFDYYRNTVNPNGGVMNDPYSVLPTCGRRLGEPFLDSFGYVDNITNHGLGD